GAYVEAITRSDTSIVYLAATDTSGQFDVGPLPNGSYVVRAIIDQNSNRALDRNEKWDSTVVTIGDVRPTIELDAIERDTLPPQIDNITVIDSVSIRVSYDKPLDPALPLQPALVRLQRADSSELQVTRVEWAAAFDHAKQARDSARRADSLKTAQPPAAPTQPAQPPAAAPPIPVPTPGSARPAPPPPKPKAPPPERAFVITLAPNTPVLPTVSYRLATRGVRNLLGRAADVTRPFTVPRPPPPPKPPADTTKRPPTDSTRRPPR
ncbi:MAG: hypothetical protein ACRDMZ_17420, partial [Solirubrobacteraceae bacterium]